LLILKGMDMHNFETQDRFIRLRAQGMSLRNIAKTINIANSTAIAWNRKLSWGINAAKRNPVDAVLGGFGVHREERLKALGIIAKNIKEKALTSAGGELSYGDIDYFLKINKILVDEEGYRNNEMGYSPVKFALDEAKHFEKVQTGYEVLREEDDDEITLTGCDDEEIDIKGTQLEKELEAEFGPGPIDEYIFLTKKDLKRYNIGPESVQNRCTSDRQNAPSGAE
jgi:hypothetical protein